MIAALLSDDNRWVNGQRIEVSGGNKGIGLEISRNLSGAGCTVLLSARDEKRGQQAVQVLQQARRCEVHFIEIDVTTQDTITAASELIESDYGRLDILINKAGVNLRGDGLPGAADVAVVETIFDTNFFGALRVAQTMLPLLHKSPADRIVNISSGLSLWRLEPSKQIASRCSMTMAQREGPFQSTVPILSRPPEAFRSPSVNARAFSASDESPCAFRHRSVQATR